MADQGITQDDLATLTALDVDLTPEKDAKLSPKEERTIAGFEDIQRFVEAKGRRPQDREEADIFERIYAVRLAQIKQCQECRKLVEGMDHQGLLDENDVRTDRQEEDMDDATLLAELGTSPPASDIQNLKHVRPYAEKNAPEEMANRQTCADFAKFKPLFDEVRDDLRTGKRETRPFELKAEIEQGRFFIVNGQVSYVAEKGQVKLTNQGRTDARLRVIYDNGTESNLLMRSLQRALNADEAGRRITDPIAGPLFSGVADENELASGTIYVLRSKSDDPYIRENRDLVHKIGVTTNPIEQRIATAHLQPTFLMAGVEVVATYGIYKINPIKLENLIHRIFAKTRLEIEIKDRLNRPIVPREWFLVPLFAIDRAVELIRLGKIDGKVYDPSSADFIDATRSPKK